MMSDCDAAAIDILMFSLLLVEGLEKMEPETWVPSLEFQSRMENVYCYLAPSTNVRTYLEVLESWVVQDYISAFWEQRIT